MKTQLTKRFYIQVGVIRYSVKVYPVSTKSNYNTAIHISMIGEKMPVWGTIIKDTDNAREIAQKVIDTWTK